MLISSMSVILLSGRYSYLYSVKCVLFAPTLLQKVEREKIPLARLLISGMSM